MSVLLKLDAVHCGYRGHPVVQGLSMEVEASALVCLLGPSGCGKTTVLRAIAGFEPVSGGYIRLRDRIVSSPDVTLPPEKRHLGMVFQDYALFPHLSVAANVRFGLTGIPTPEANRRVDEMLELVGLQGLARRYPHELSGGQQQRVALARALAPQPEAVLMDEPFSGLDVDLRARVSAEVRDILKARRTTGILVTHDQHEAFALGDQIGVMQHGRLLQWDTAYNLYHEPANRFVADFIGQGVFLPGTVLGPDAVDTEIGVLRGGRAFTCPKGTAVDVLLRPDDLAPANGDGLQAEILSKAFQGPETMYTLRLRTGTRVLSMFPSHYDHAVGARVAIRVVATHLVAFPRRTNHADPDQ